MAAKKPLCNYSGSVKELQAGDSVDTGGITLIATATPTGVATVSFTDIPATYAYLILQASGVSSTVAARHPWVRVSTNNGSSYDSTAANYESVGGIDVGAWENGTEASLLGLINSSAAVSSWSWTLNLMGYQGGPNMTWGGRFTDAGTPRTKIIGAYLGSTSAINALRILWNGSGNFDAGTIDLYGGH